MSYKWNYFGEMLRRPNLSEHVPLASSVWQGRHSHCLNLSEQLIGVVVLMPFVIRAFVHPTRCASLDLPLWAWLWVSVCPKLSSWELWVEESLGIDFVGFGQS